MYPTGLALRPGRRPTGQLCTGVYNGLGRRLSRSLQEHEQEAAQELTEVGEGRATCCLACQAHVLTFLCHTAHVVLFSWFYGLGACLRSRLRDHSEH